MIARLGILVMSALLLSGAQAPPGAAPPAPQAPPAPAQGAPGPTPAPAQAETTPSPPGATAQPRGPGPRKEVRVSLKEAIQWAVMKNLNLASEELNRDIVERELIIARATFDPFFNLSASYQRNREPSASLIDFDPITGAGGGVGVRVSPSEAASVRGAIRGLTPIGSTYQFSLVESRFSNPESSLLTLDPRYQTRAEFTVTQPLLRGGWWAYNQSGIQTALNNINLSRDQLELSAIAVTYEVEAAYWELVFALRNFDSKLKALEVAREQLRIDQKKFEVGTKARIDVTTSDAQVARRQTELDRAEALVADAQDQLLDRMNFVGLAESLRDLWERGGRAGGGQYVDLTIIPTTEPDTSPIAVDRGQAIREAFDQRVEYRQATTRIKNQELAVEVAKNELLPALDLSASWYQLGLDDTLHGSADLTFDGDYYDWSAAVLFEIPLSLRGPRARLRNAIDFKRRFQLERQTLENTIVLEVDKAIRDVEYAHRAVENLRQQVALQEELLRAERVKLDVGKSIAYTVAQIENDLIAIQAQELRARADYEISKAALDRAVGRLLLRRGIQLGL